MRESRERLGLDHLPLVYLHDPERISFSEATASGGPVEAMCWTQADGVIGHLGVAGGPIELLRRYADTGVFEVVITHNRFTLLDRSAQPLLNDCAGAGVAVVNAAPFGSGLLAKGPHVTDRYFYQSAPPQVIEATERIQADPRAPWCAAGRRSAAVLPASSAHRLHHRRHHPAGAGRTDARTRPASDSGVAVARDRSRTRGGLAFATTTFATIGSGRRTRFFPRLARAMPERPRVSGVR